MRRRPIVVLLAVLLSGVKSAFAAEIETLRAENARLRARVAELEQALGKATAAAPLAAAVARRAESTIHVDASDQQQTIATDQMRVDAAGGLGSRHWITLRARRFGGDPTIELVIDAAGTNGAYRGAETIELSIDGQPASAPVTRVDRYALGPSRGAGKTRRADDRVVATLSRDLLERLANAASVTATVRTTTLTWAPDHIAAARALRDRLAQ